MRGRMQAHRTHATISAHLNRRAEPRASSGFRQRTRTECRNATKEAFTHAHLNEARGFSRQLREPPPFSPNPPVTFKAPERFFTNFFLKVKHLLRASCVPGRTHTVSLVRFSVFPFVVTVINYVNVCFCINFLPRAIGTLPLEAVL